MNKTEDIERLKGKMGMAVLQWKRKSKSQSHLRGTKTKESGSGISLKIIEHYDHKNFVLGNNNE